nr:MAG TPA: hypothetical protein [Caudoviricetes sp.]
MIKVNKTEVTIDGKSNKLVKDLCYAVIALRYKTLDEGINMGFDREEIDSEFKMLLLGGIANSLSDDEDGFVSSENAAQKLFEITERAFAKCKKGMN